MGRVGGGDNLIAEIESRQGAGRRTLPHDRNAHGLAHRLRQQLGLEGGRDANHGVEVVFLAPRLDADLPFALFAGHVVDQRQIFILSRETDFILQIVKIGALRVADAIDDGAARYAFDPGRCAHVEHADGATRAFDAVRLVHENEADETENHIHDHAGGDDRHALPDRLVLEGARIVVLFLALGSLTKHLDVAAQREPGNLVERLPLLEAATRNCWTKADTERFDVYVTPLGDGEMAKLMDENDKAQS